MATRDDLGFLLAKLRSAGTSCSPSGSDVPATGRSAPPYGSVLLPLLEEDGLRMGELGRRSRLSKQTMTTLVRLAERDGLVARRPDPADARADARLADAARAGAQAVADGVLEELASLVAALGGAEQAAELKRLLKGVMEL